MKLGVTLYEKGNETVAEATEVVEDLIAEAKAEMARAGRSGAAANRDNG
jgi:polyhydroxyalkanoate synthesis regulator phasin